MTRNWSRGVIAAGVLLSGAIAYACTTDTAIGPDAALDSLYIEPANAVMVLDDTLHLTAVGVDKSGRRFVNTRVKWVSHDATITLTSNGSAIALSVGGATVAASAGHVTASAALTVQPKPTFATSRDSVAFNAFANGPTPAATTLTITNAGGGTLTPIVDSIHYASGPTAWLQTSIARGTGTDTLGLSVTNGTLAVGTYTATVFLSSPKATPKQITAVLTLTADAPNAMAIDSGNGQTATVNTALAKRPTVLVRDQYNNPVAGASVAFAVTGGGGSVAPATAVTTDASGRARPTGWTLGTAAGANTLQASIASVTPVTFTATGTADIPAATTKAAGDAQSATVNTAVAAVPTLRVADQFGNPVESVTVTFSIGSGGGSIAGATKKTDGAGLAAVGSWTLGKVSGANTLAATAASLPAATFSATGDPDAADSLKLSGGDAQTDTVKATLATPYTARVADQFGNGVPGVTVTWGVSGGGSITPSSVTNSSGIASATRVFGTAAGPQGASASVAGLIGSPVSFSATATHGAATAIVKAAGDNQSATAGAAVGISPTAQVTDQYGNPVPGIAVTFAVTAGGGNVAPTSSITTDATGNATVASWTLGPSSGTNNNTLTASASGLTSVGFLASGLSGSAKNLVYVSGNALTDTIGAPLGYTVQVTDVNSNGVQGIPVSWQVTLGGGSITVSSTTDVNGFATATRVLGTVVGLDSATASVGGLTGSPVRFGATALHGNPALISKTAGDGQSATVNTAVTTAPQVWVTDRASNPISGASVTFAVSGGAGTTSPASPAGLTTNGSGFAQLTSWTLGTGAGVNSISATSTGTPGASFSATGTPDAPSAAQSLVADNTVSITACSAGCTFAGGTADSVTVTVRDQFSNPISGASVTVSSTGSANTFSLASGSSNASGIFKTLLNSTFAEAKTISASATTGLGGGAISQTAAVTVNPAGVSASQSSVAATTASITACSAACVAGSTASTITITVRDPFNNVISNATVTPASSGTGNTLNPGSGLSNGSGVFTTTFNSTVAQGKTISATANAGAGAVAITQTAAVTVNAAAPATVSVVNQGFSARVGTGVGTLPTYTVRDAFSNLVPNVAVSYSSSGSGAFSGPATTNASGQATLTSWTMAGTSADDASGLMANNVTLFAGGASNTATDYGIYTYSGDASPILSGCDGCHYVNWTRANIVGQPDQNPSGYTACSGYTLVTAGNASASLIYLKTAGTSVGGVPPCGAAMPSAAGLSAATRKILRAWINNGAPNN
jgi:adhesin/invasin